MTDAESPGDTLSSALQAARERYLDAAGLVCDYIGLARSPERGRLEEALAGLEGYDPRRAPIPGLVVFWLNVYNACSLIAGMEVERGGELRRIGDYFERGRVRVAGFAYSLDDIEHGLLRGNEHRHGSLLGPLARDDPRLAFTPLIYDERMHFALFSACRSTPALRVYHAGRLEDELEEAAREHLRRSARIEDAGAVVVMPKPLHWYAKDFGGEAGVLEFVLSRLEDEAAIDLVDRRRGRVRLRYAEFDWTLNEVSPQGPLQGR